MDQVTAPKPGDVVVYHTERNEARNALVTCAWGTEGNPSINLRIVSSDEVMTDSHGRQTVAVTSVSHVSNVNAPGRYWRRLNEEGKPHQRPAAT